MSREGKSNDLTLGSIIFIWGIVALIVWLIGSTLWSGLVMPGLGKIGLIEYKSKTQVRYEAFLDKAKDCENKKVLFSEKSQKYPVFHLFECRGGNEMIWKYKVKVVKKVSESKWVLE